VADSSFKAVKAVRGFLDALLEINVAPSHGEHGSRRESDQSLKHDIEAYYSAVSGWATGHFWNWGMHDDGIQRAITQQLGAFDQLISDGFSEQLYYFTLSQMPRTNGASRRVLEVGSGAGAGLNFLSRLESQSEFVGVDLSRQAVARAHEVYSRPHSVSFVLGDAENLPFEDAAFDAVINVESSHNYPNLDRFLSEVSRVLRPNGCLSLVDMFSDKRYALMQKCQQGSSSTLGWLAETDISDRVAEAIRRRALPGSLMRQEISRAFRLTPWPVGAIIRSSTLKGLGRGATFTEPRAKVLPLRRPPRDFLTASTSYRHVLAQKRDERS
jgi:ubiquinone/menaquinone biosynthesis C-methylase UbiE